MLKKQIVIDVSGNTEEELTANIKAAGTALATKSLEDAEDSGDANFCISRGPTRADDWSPNTLYVAGTNAEGKVVISGSRTTFDAHKDHHIMDAALELSQAVELRGVDFKEHKIGSLLVRPVPKERPQRDAAPLYELSHITDLVQLTDEDIPYFITDLPGLIATLRFAKDECDKRGNKLVDVLPKLQYVADSSGTVTLRSGNETDGITVSGVAVMEGWKREQPKDAGCPGQCKVVRDQDAPQHGCCQTCEKVVKLG